MFFKHRFTGLLAILTVYLFNQVNAHYNPQINEFEQHIRDSPDLKQVCFNFI